MIHRFKTWLFARMVRQYLQNKEEAIMFEMILEEYEDYSGLDAVAKARKVGSIPVIAHLSADK